MKISFKKKTIKKGLKKSGNSVINNNNKYFKSALLVYEVNKHICKSVLVQTIMIGTIEIEFSVHSSFGRQESKIDN